MRPRSHLQRRLLQKRGRGAVATTGLTPLVDVVFLLLLFLVLTARFIPEEHRFDLRLPESQPPSVERYLEPFRLEVRQTAGGPISFAGGDAISDRSALVERLAAVPERIPVVVTGEDAVPYAAVVQAYDACLEAGVKRIVLSVVGETDRAAP
jgi:biopolymer transport protein ExbD